MSCDGFGVNDLVRAIAAISFTEQDRQFQIRAEATGTIRKIDTDKHRITVYWPSVDREVVFEHGQIHQYLRRQ